MATNATRAAATRRRGVDGDDVALVERGKGKGLLVTSAATTNVGSLDGRWPKYLVRHLQVATLVLLCHEKRETVSAVADGPVCAFCLESWPCPRVCLAADNLMGW